MVTGWVLQVAAPRCGVAGHQHADGHVFVVCGTQGKIVGFQFGAKIVGQGQEARVVGCACVVGYAEV